MENKITLTNKLLISGISVFFLLVLISGFLGLYTLKNSYTETSRYIEAVNLARESQLYFQDQFHLWNMIILQGETAPDYGTNYHSFSRYNDKVQDTLFNLKLLCNDFKSIPEEINDLRIKHKNITMDYLAIISNLENFNSNNKKEIFHLSKDQNERILGDMDGLVLKIQQTSAKEIKRVNDYYFILTLAVLVLLATSVIAMGAYLAKKILNIHKELDAGIKKSTKELIKANEDLEEANIKISLSEMKYRLLVDNSSDIIFSMDEDWNFINANKAVEKHLKIKPEKIKSYNLLQLLKGYPEDVSVTKEMIEEKLETFSKDRKPASFIAAFISSFASEPKEMNVKMEYIEVEGISEIHGIISPVIEDSLLKYFVSERQRYEIGNYLTTVEDITFNMVKNLKKYMDGAEASLLRIGLREMIINAIEHGNLEISYEEKSNALANDTYRKLIEERRMSPSCKNKKVSVEYLVAPDKALFKITDQGSGFDHRRALNNDGTEQNVEGIAHGRGISMSRQIFDEIKYNDAGNQVMLTKKFQE